MKTPKKHGFTLTEIVTVITIAVTLEQLETLRTRLKNKLRSRRVVGI